MLQRLAWIRTGSDWIRTEANFGRIRDWIGLMIFKNVADQDWIGFNFIGSGMDLD